MARLYANENFPLPVVEGLRRLGHNVLTTRETGKAGQRIPDKDVLEFATTNGRAVVTLNRRDFIRLHEQGIEHTGIVVCTDTRNFDAQARRIHAAIESVTEWNDLLIRVNQPQRPPVRRTSRREP